MMKKVVPLAILIGSSVAVDNNVFDSTWTAVTSAYPSGAATTCCFLTGDVNVGSTGTLTGTATGSTAAGTTTDGVTTGRGPCYGYDTTGGSSAFTSANNLALTLQDPTAAIGPASTAATLANNAKYASITTVADGSSAILTLAPSGNAPTGTCTQTLTRKVATAPSSDFLGSWVVGAAGTDTTCCYLVPGTIAINSANSLVKASGVKTADTTACSSHASGRNADYTVTLEPGATNVANTLLSGTTADKFTLGANDKTTLTWASKGSNTCTQTFNKVPASSALNLAMAPVAVGAAVMGLVVV